MSKLGSWRFGCVKIKQDLLLEPSIDKQRELSCAPNNKGNMDSIRCTNKFPPFFIKNWAFIVNERNLMFYSKYCPSYCSSFVWHESWSNNACNSASSYTLGLPLHSLSSMSNLPFLNFWNHSRQLFSLKAALPYVSTRNRCVSAADFFKLKN